MLGALSLAATTVLGGCGKEEKAKEESTKKEEVKPGELPDEEVEIKFMSWHGEESDSLYYDGIKAVMDDYTEKHPNVTFEYIYQPQDGYQELLDTQFIANTAADIIHMQTRMNNDYANKGVLYDLNNALTGKSAYSDKESWFDTFVGGAESFATARGGNQYGGIFFIPNDENPSLNIGQPIIYNKEIFKEAGLDPEDPPETWSEFMDVCQALKDAGTIPIAADNSRWIGWSLGDIGNQFGEKAVDEFFSDEYNDDPQGVYYTDKQKIALANGDISDLEYYDDVLKIWKDYAQYWQDGWTGTTFEEASNLFFMQEAAMQKIGSWDHMLYKETIGDSFEYGIFPVPYIDEAVSDKSIGAFKAPTGQQKYGFAVNKSVEEDPVKEAYVLDFLQFFSSIEEQNKYCEIAQSFSPVDGVEVPEELQGYVVPTEKATANQVLGVAFIELGDGAIWNGYAQDYLTGNLDSETFKQKAAELSQTAAQEYCMNLLKPEGYAQQLTDAKAQLEEMEANGADDVAIQAQKDTVEGIEAREKMMKEYLKEQ